MHDYLHKLSTSMQKLEELLLALLLLVTILIPVIQIALRNIWGTGLLWGDSVVRFGVLWITLTGAMLASRAGQHIGIEVIHRYLSPTWKRNVDRVIYLFTTGVCFVAAYYCYQFILMEYEGGDLAFAGIPLWVVELIMPVAFAVIGLRYAIQAISPQSTSAEPMSQHSRGKTS
jgi:TRAP-type C4-dicarboxylate transport system permease small subunit